MNTGDILSLKDGKAIILSIFSNTDVIIKFTETGNILQTTRQSILRDEIKDRLAKSVHGVGCIGAGIYRSKTKAYGAWRAMLSRCYNPKDECHRWYKDCTVCDEWLNFQNYAEWYYKNRPIDDQSYHVDKDIKVKGNRIYSPETCIIIKSVENIIYRKASSGGYIKNLLEIELKSPSGDTVKITNINEFCRQNSLDESALRKVSKGKRPSHKGWTKP